MDGWKSSMPLTFKKLPNLTQIFIFRGGKGDKCTCDDSCNARTVTNAVSMTRRSKMYPEQFQFRPIESRH